MFRWPAMLFYAFLAFLCWGAYGVTLHVGQDAMGHSRWRPFICVGLAYFLVAVLVPAALIRRGGEKGRWTWSGTIWSLIAGGLGCLGALGVLMAFNLGGSPDYVMPLIFGCAPVVNTLVTLLLTRDARPNLPFLAGIAMVALGAAGVLWFKPSVKVGSVSSLWELWTMVAVALTAACWGSYGTALHKGQVAMEGSRLRAFMCVGIAYFFLAIIVPLVIMATSGDSGGWTLRGVSWSIVAGVFGAVGALAVLLAFNAGGSPVFVMPLVFGGAPVVNLALTTYLRHRAGNASGTVTLPFLSSLVLVIVGAVTVLLFAPRRHASSGATSSVKA